MMLFCWVLAVRTNKLESSCMRGRFLNQMGVASTDWPSDIATSPYIVRRAIPVIITLDGAVFYPQLIGVDPAVTSTDTALSAQFLGR